MFHPWLKNLQARATVSLTMIVRDEEKNLPSCLESVRGLFDEIVVVDTGSKDRTREIAREFAVRVFDFVWVDDFASARNAALARATGDYAFWLDADDVIDPPEREKLQALLDSLQVAEAGGPEWSAQRTLRGSLCAAVLVRSGAEWRWWADGRRSYPAVSAPRGRALVVSRARADLCRHCGGQTCR